MTERPIIFDGHEVRALLAGTKTQTRRAVKLVGAETVEERDGALWPWSPEHDDWVPCPFGAPGDRLWVRETWAPCEALIRKGHIQYAADGAVGHHVSTNGGENWWERSGHTMGLADPALHGVWLAKPSRWRPSIHMPRRASRLTLEVTGVRVERLQSISEGDAIAEGVERTESGLWKGYQPDRGAQSRAHMNPAKSFASLWESINGADSWAANPWVWVVTFKRVTP